MAITTSQQIAKYYAKYQNNDVTFNKQVIATTGLEPKEVFMKVSGHQVPCLIYSTSMVGARVIANVTAEVNERIREANNTVSIRFAFRRPEDSAPIRFFVPGKVTAYQPYGGGRENTNFVTIAYTNRPPDDLIETLGRLLDVNVEAKRRSEERIVLTRENQQRLGIESRDTLVLIQGVPRKCIIRDVSFGGAKVILVGLAKFMMDRNAVLKLRLTGEDMPLEIPGKVVRHEDVEERQDIAAIAIKFDETKVPMQYKMRLHEYLQSAHR